MFPVAPAVGRTSEVVPFVKGPRRHGRVETEHAWHGKVASLLLFGVLLACSFALGEVLMAWLLWSTAAVVVFSALGYVQKGVHQLTTDQPG
jgi:hypothetical protein